MLRGHRKHQREQILTKKPSKCSKDAKSAGENELNEIYEARTGKA